MGRAAAWGWCFLLLLAGCTSYKVVLDSDYYPRAEEKKKVSVLGVLPAFNDSSGFYGFGHTKATRFDTKTLNMLADKIQRYFSESIYFETYDKIDIDRIIQTQSLQSSDLFDSSREIIPQLGNMIQCDCVVLARLKQNFTMMYLPVFTWWYHFELELKMVEIDTLKVYLSAYAGGRSPYSFSRDLMYEEIINELFEELHRKIRERRPSSDFSTNELE